MEPGSPEWQARLIFLLDEESRRSLRWFFLSFADRGPGGFLGGIFTEANGPVTAIEKTKRLGINPGGEVMCVPVRAEYVTLFSRHADRLLTRAELDQITAVH